MLPIASCIRHAAFLAGVFLADLVSAQSTFNVYQEFYGQRAYTDPAAATNLLNGMATGVSFSSPIDSGLTTFVSSHRVNLMMTFPGAALPDGLSAASIKLIVVALKIFFRFLTGRGSVRRDPAEGLSLPRIGAIVTVQPDNVA